MRKRRLRFVPRFAVFAALILVVELSASPQPSAEPNAAAPAESSLGTLEWMVGQWEGVDGDVRSEEVWTAPAGGLMLGLHRDVRPSGSAFFEYLRIVDAEGGLVYVAQPLGRPPTEFRLREIGKRHVLFENPDHDFPQRISYRRDLEDVLVVRIAGESGGETKTVEWRWSLVE